jgi:flotillin
VIVSTGGENGSGAGASKLTQDVTNIIAQVPATIEALTGMDLMGAIGNLPGLKKTVDGDGQAEKVAKGSKESAES